MDLQDLETWLLSCKSQLEAKANNPFQLIAFQQEIPVIEWQGYVVIKNCIATHNRQTTDFQTSVVNARKAIEYHHVASKCEEYNSHCQSATETQEQISNIDQQITTLNNNIISLEKDIVSHRKPAESLNDSLKKYLPYCDLKFDIKDNGYVIKRGDQIAKDLSEGEKTTIAFLYFLQSLEDKDFKIAEGIVVIDDPVSSLDSNCLHQTFSLLKNRLSDCKQLFIMTHNFYFYRNVKEWIKHFKAKAKKYFLNTLKNNTGRYSTIEMASKSLVQHESEYHYLFEYIHKAAHDEESNETIIFHAPNAARRLLESFLSFKKPMYAGRFYEQLKEIDYDEEKKTAIYRLVLINSHHEYVSTLEEEFISIPQTKEVLKYLLGLIKKLDEEHFNDMVQTFSP
jgi:wobble nucleotide-excising tRNase